MNHVTISRNDGMKSMGLEDVELRENLGLTQGQLLLAWVN
jgi:hypothetical protein